MTSESRTAKNLVVAWLLIVVSIAPKSAVAASDITQIEHRWKRFVSLCGAALRDPGVAITRNVPSDGNNSAGHEASPDGKFVVAYVGQSSVKAQGAYGPNLSVARHSDFESRRCYYEDYGLVEAGTLVEAASGFLEAARKDPSVEIVGGRMSPARRPYFHFSLIGVWPNIDAPVQVLIVDDYFRVDARYIAPTGK